MFDAAQERSGASLTRAEIWDILEPFFGSEEAYFAPAKGDDDDSSGGEEKAKDLVQRAGGWLSNRFGSGKGANFNRMAAVYEAIANWATTTKDTAIELLVDGLNEFKPVSKDRDGVLKLISGPGYKSATRNIVSKWDERPDLKKLREAAFGDGDKCKNNTGGKGRRPWSDIILAEVEATCGFTYLQPKGPARHKEFSVMLDHAARRVSICHSWIKRAEAERRKFNNDAQKLGEVSEPVRKWLENFSESRSGETGALEEYRIRKRALGGKNAKAWKTIVRKWTTNPSLSVEERVEIVHQIQSEWDEDEKFGDEQLFKKLAEVPEFVWQDSNVLIDYVAAKEARAKQQRFKVPAYRHPDPLSHPVFCDFGNSRWEIRFDIHEKFKNRSKKRPSKDKDFVANVLHMGLWDGERISDEIPLRWGCKRLNKDLGLQANGNGELFDVTRADRAGRAIVGADVNSSVNIVGLFDQKDWNGRLQAPRQELDAIARRLKKNNDKWNHQTEKMRRRLHWLVTFSVKLQPLAPTWQAFAAKHGLSNNPLYWPHSEENKKRKGMARLVLCRLPGLRLLSVDLGHRFAAACAVWETLSREEMIKACRAANDREPTADDLYIHLERKTEKTQKSGKRKGQPVIETQVYRRIGADTLPDGSPHPAPWARLDRQFLVKLQGEDRPARALTPAEKQFVEQLEAEVNYVRGGNERDKLPHRVDELMEHAVRIARLALCRHTDYARIAFRFTKREVNRTIINLDELVPGDQTEHLADVLMLWYGLATSARWKDDWATEQWNLRTLPLIQRCPFTEPPPLEGDDARNRKKIQKLERVTEQWRTAWNRLQKPLTRRTLEEEEQEERIVYKANKEAIRSLLLQVADLLRQNSVFRNELQDLWAARWSEQNGYCNADKSEQKRPLTGWYKRLRELRNWILPRSIKKRSEGMKTIRRVGGLSLTRISTIRSLWQIHKAFRYGPKPENIRAGIELIEEDAAKGCKFGDRMLQTMEHMREQRVKQLSSRIIEAALGIGSENRKKHWSQRSGKLSKTQRPRQRVFEPCHAIVIEDLTNYKPQDLRTRRENRQLMVWSAGKVKKYLAEGCQLYGLHRREIPAHWTSLQDSRTGLPGVRCQDVKISEFLTAPWWNRAINSAKKKIEESGNDGNAEERLLLKMRKYLAENNRQQSESIRLPRTGGDLFVAIDGHTLQADLNAAANIGLRAILDPDWPGRWWYIPCYAVNGKPVPEKIKGSPVFAAVGSLITDNGGTTKKQRKTKRNSTSDGATPQEKQIVNLWRKNCSCDEFRAEEFCQYQPYWKTVRQKVAEKLEKFNRQKVAAADSP